MNYDILMRDALELLVDTNVVDYDGSTEHFSYILEGNVIGLTVPRCVGKTRFIDGNARSKDLIITSDVNSYNITDASIMHPESLCKLKGSTGVFDVVFFDNVQVTKKLITCLASIRKINTRTRIFALRTPQKSVKGY